MAHGKSIYLCGTPSEYCVGKLALLSNGLKNKGLRSHQTSVEAFNCFKKSLLARGYVQIDSRAFQPPEGGPIHVLTKQSRFGARMRPGKEGTRNNPAGRRGGGVCISK